MRRLRHLLILLILAIFALLLTGSACAAGDFSLRFSGGSVTAYTDNVLTIEAPGLGTVTLTVGDAYGEFFRRSWQVEEGTQQLHWDGTRTDGQRVAIYLGSYTWQASFAGENGQTAAAQGTVTVEKSRQTLLYALPSSDTLYLGGGEDWFVEWCPVRSGTAVLEVVSASDPDRVLVRKRKGISGDPSRYKWNGTDGDGKALPAGAYLVRCCMEESPDLVTTLPLQLVDSPAPVEKVAPTGAILPTGGESEAELWALMQKPSVVVDITATNHQKVYAEPSTGSEVLGTLHGQSQALEVKSISGDWAKITAWQHEDGSQVTGYVPVSRLKVVYPNSHYGLVVDKQQQTLQLYVEGRLTATLPISTGLMAEKKLIRETAAGAFLTLEHMADFTDSGRHYLYPIRYDGGNLLHQIGFQAISRHASFGEQRASLGTKSSHGCVRIPDQPTDDSGITAYWLWTHLPWHTRVFILDDTDQRLAQRAALTGEAIPTATPVPVPTATPAPAIPAEEDTVLTITLGGDAVLGTREKWWKREDALPAYLEKYGMSWPFDGLQALFASDDLTFVNLECVLKANSADEVTSKQYRFRGLPSWTEALRLGSVELVNIANNHYVDYGASGKKATRQALTAADIPFSGYGFTWVWEVQGHKIGFAGIRETIYKREPKQIAKDIATLRQQGCEVVIYACHWGTEYSPTHNDLQLEMAQAAVAASADLVVGAHPHVVQGIAQVGGVPVLWSLGNLMFGGTIDMTTFDAMVCRVALHFDDSGYKGCTLTPIPILTSSQAADGLNDYHPVIAEGEDKARIWQLIQADSELELSEDMWFPGR